MKRDTPEEHALALVIIDRYRNQPGTLIEVLQDIQAAYGYVPRETVELIAEELGYSAAHIYSVLTFYAQFYLTPRGKHVVRVCQGTACHVMGGKQIFDYLSLKMGIKDGETTRDNQFTLERVACVGACGMAPVMVVDEHVYGALTLQRADAIIAQCSSTEAEARGTYRGW